MSAPSPAAPEAAGQNATRRVLVVDDERDVRELCEAILGKAGCQVTTAASGEEALSLLPGDVDLLLTDLHMPGKVGGKDLAVAARAGGADAIIMTAFPDTESAIQAVKSGVFDYLVKPFTAATLRSSAERCFQKRDLLKALQESRNAKAEMDNAYQELAWTEKIKGIYGQFTSPDVVRMVLEQPGEFWKRGEERDITLFAAEVVNFAENVAGRPPQDKIDTLNRILNFLTEAIQAEMGHINQINGEAVMALFGAPVAIIDNAAAAVRAARRIRNLWGAFSASQRPTQGESPLGLRMALHSGRVITGCLGIKTGTEFSVIGPSLRTAEELLKTAKPGQVLMSRETARRTQKDYKLKNHGVCVGGAYRDEVWELE
jgi:class 3 adenylate cyclase/FixJ family two-component response regulator